MIRSLFLSTAILITVSAGAQRSADIGIRLNTAEYNRVQIEFRKPSGDFSYFRFGLSIGSSQSSPYTKLHDVTDSIVTMREYRNFGSYYDFRFGFERTLKYPWLSIHCDLIFNYAQISKQNWSYFYLKDSLGAWQGSDENPFSTLSDPTQTATAVGNWLGGGAALGLSFNFPVSENLIINFTGNYTGVVRSMISQSEANDNLNEFEYTPQTLFEVYPSAGAGVRFVFDTKSIEEAPAPED